MNRASVIVTGTVFAVWALVSTAAADDMFKKAQKGAEGAAKGVGSAIANPGRSAECAQGDTKVQRKIAHDTVAYAKTHWKIEKLMMEPADTSRAEREVYDLLSWKLGSPSLVCGQYITAGQHHFNNAYNAEAAAALLGMNLPGDGKAEFALPPQVSKELKQTIKDCEQLVLNAAKEAGVSSESSGSATPPAGQSKTADPKAMADEAAAKKLHEKLQGLPQKCAEQVNRLSAKLEKDYGIPREQLNLAIVQVAAAGVKFVDRVGFNMPKSYNVKRELVVKLIDERQQQLAGGTTGQPVGAVQTKKPQ